MRLLAVTCLAAATLVAACSTTVNVSESKKVRELRVPPESVTFIWSAAKPPSYSSLPAMGGMFIGGPSQREVFQAYPSEFTAFAEALRPQLEAHTELRPAFVRLPSSHSQEQLDRVLQEVRKRSAVVLMYPEKVTGYCAPGCYAFSVRVNYLSAQQRRLVWTGVIETPPKNNHHDSFEPVARTFAQELVKQLKDQELVPR